MNTKKCPSCDKSISIKAKRCPYCREDLRGFFRRHPILTVLLVLITSPFWIAILVGFTQGITGTTSQNKETSTKQTVLNASVHFTGTQFVISNLDKHDCQNAKLEINGGFLKGGYTLDGYNLEAGQEYTVGASQFADKDGTRFNPFSVKPKNFNVSCRGNNEMSTAYWYGEFN